MYAEELIARTKSKERLIIILFTVSISVLMISMWILYPIVSKVNTSKNQLLSLFIDIPNENVSQLFMRCEKYILEFNIEKEDED